MLTSDIVTYPPFARDSHSYSLTLIPVSRHIHIVIGTVPIKLHPAKYLLSDLLLLLFSDMIRRFNCPVCGGLGCEEVTKVRQFESTSVVANVIQPLSSSDLHRYSLRSVFQFVGTSLSPDPPPKSENSRGNSIDMHCHNSIDMHCHEFDHDNVESVYDGRAFGERRSE